MNAQTQPNGTANPAEAMVVARESAMDAYRRGLEPRDIDAAYKVATAIAATRYCGIGTPEEALVRIMYGRELGLSAIASIRAVYIVNDRPGLDASVMHGLCLTHPTCEYFEVVSTDAKQATFIAKRKGRPEKKLTWTIEQAHQAGALGGRPSPDGKGQTKAKDNWVNYPENMLRARCISNLARMVFPEAVNGMYTPDEIESGEAQASPQTVEVDARVVAKAVDAGEQLAADLIKAIGEVTNAEQKKAARKRFDDAVADGTLAGAFKEKVASAYNARFAGKKKQDAPREGAPAPEPAATAPTQPAPQTAPEPPPSADPEVPAHERGDAWEPAT